MSLSETIHVFVEYIIPPPGRPLGSIRFWSDTGATEPWDGTTVEFGETRTFVMGRTDASDGFSFDSVTFWYEAGSPQDEHRAAQVFSGPQNSDPLPVNGMAVAGIHVDPSTSGNLSFIVANSSKVDHDASLGVQISLKDNTKGATKNGIFTSRDPQVKLPPKTD